jgi:U32 family peptidase
MTSRSPQPELLAPAGDLESFHAAIDAGADAVYLGLDGFNARMRAKNFTARTLSTLVPYAHAKKRKIYITLNTLVKQAEIEQCVHLLYQLDRIGPDAIIVQDLGVVDMCRRYFPRLRLHASTQMSIHNSLGVKAAEDMGISRVVLARELTFDEIAAIRRESAVELETFVHGALCYSLSGMCLASSFLGGFSGNRGRCTQVCRRPFQARGGKGNFYSPADFCALQRIETYKAIGVDSLKIEGRMKNEEYVFTVVSAYRKAIDDPALVPALLERIDFDLGRRKCALFLDGVRQEGIIDPSGPSGTGIPVGLIERCCGQEVAVTTKLDLFTGDVVRIQPASGFEGKAYRVEKAATIDGTCNVELKGPVQCTAGDMVYVTRRMIPDKGEVGRRAVSMQPVPYGRFYPKVNELLNFYSPKKNRVRAEETPALTVIIDDPGWRGLIFPDLVDGLVAVYGKSDVEKYFLQAKPAEAWKKKVAIGFPPFIPEDDIGFWRHAARTSVQMGICRAQFANIGQWRLFDSPLTVFSDFYIWCFNRAAQKALADKGVSHFSYSPEDDFPNMRNSASRQGTATLFSHAPLFISRVKPALPEGDPCTDSFGNEFFTAEKHGLYYLVSKKPLCLFHKRKKLEEAGITSFAIDLRFCKPDKGVFKDLLRRYEHEAKVEGSSMFNFKLGIR